MAKKKTTEEFKEQVRAIHGDRYGLDLVEYVNNKVKVKLVCKKHGIFEMTPNCLLSGQNCPQCAKEEHAQKMTKDYDYVIGKFKEMHGDRYCYDKVEYTNMLKKVCITCKKHGDFWMTPAHFIEGHGCPECAKAERSISKRRTMFLKKLKLVHGDKYLTDKVKYVNNKTKVILTCKVHGDFEARPDSLLSGCGCPKCGDESRKEKLTSNTDEFIAKAKLVHGDKYTYENVVYKSWNEKVSVTCPIHGDFLITPNHLLGGEGCKQCGIENRAKSRSLGIDALQNKSNDVHNGKYKVISQSYVNAKNGVEFECPIHGKFVQTPDSHLAGHGCPKCGNQMSKAEDEICSFIGGMIGDSNIIRNDRDILDGYEIDIYIPDYKLGIEFNGLHWHTENFGKDRNYHLNKTDKGLSKGIYVIQIFEDEWIEHKDIVLEKIRHFLGKSKCKVIGARKCTIKEVSKDDAKVFLNTYHIQGFVSSTVYLGAYYGNELVGVMTFLKEKEGMWNLTRFATNTNYSLPGLANKLFKYFTKEYNESIVEVKSFLDRRWSFGKTNVYEKMGFKLVEIEKPDYRYVVGNKRMHKFGFRKQRLNKLYGLPLSMTEKEMCEKLGFERIWDCGLYKYVWKKE